MGIFSVKQSIVFHLKSFQSESDMPTWNLYTILEMKPYAHSFYFSRTKKCCKVL